MPFQIHALPKEPFAPLFNLSDQQLTTKNAVRKIATGQGEPCRVSLKDATKGETLILSNYTHLEKQSPYRSSHAVYVREQAQQAEPEIDEVPELLRKRLISLRGFGTDHMMKTADVSPGTALAAEISKMFDDPDVAYIHLHNAREGCYHARVIRA